MIVYLLAAEYITADRGKGEILLFRRKHKSSSHERAREDEEAPSTIPTETQSSDENLQSPEAPGKDQSTIQEQQNVLHWRNLCYDIPVKGGTRRITDHSDGWVKPGALTALMV